MFRLKILPFILGPGAFAGYYAELLPEHCWDSTGRKVVSDENWGSAKVVMCADVENRKVTKIMSATDKPGAWSVLDVSENIIVVGYSSPTSAPQLVRLHNFVYNQHSFIIICSLLTL